MINQKIVRTISELLQKKSYKTKQLYEEVLSESSYKELLQFENPQYNTSRNRLCKVTCLFLLLLNNNYSKRRNNSSNNGNNTAAQVTSKTQTISKQETVPLN